jgi:hypothetical protein
MLAIGSPCLGDDNDASRTDRQDNSAAEQNSNSNQNSAQNQRNRADRRNDNRNNRDNRNDDDATHHAALGVSLSESSGRVNVIAVLPGSPAAKADLRVGDEIRSIGTERVHSARDVINEVAEQHPGTQVDVAIRRDGEKQNLKVTLGSQRDAFSANYRGADRAAYSYPSGGSGNGQSNASQQQQQLQQRLQGLQQQVSQLQQELNSIQASLGTSRNQDQAWRNQSGNSEGQSRNGGQQAVYNNQRGANQDGQQGNYQPSGARQIGQEPSGGTNGQPNDPNIRGN